MNAIRAQAKAVAHMGERVDAIPLTDKERACRDSKTALILAVSAFLIVVTIAAAATIIYTKNISPAISSITALQSQQKVNESTIRELAPVVTEMQVLKQRVNEISGQQTEVNEGVNLLRKWNIAKKQRIAQTPSPNAVSSHHSQPVITMKVLSADESASNNESGAEDQGKGESDSNGM